MEAKQESQPAKSKPAVTIVFETWSIPLVGLLMLFVGTFAGYNIRPDSAPQIGQSDPSPQLQQNSPQTLGNNNEDLMEYVVSQTRHFRGDPDAPVTLIEFGDFQ